jgi:hypothetical protein
VFQKGRIGGLLHLLMWGDFVVYYVYGLLYKTDIAHLYDPGVIPAASDLTNHTPWGDALRLSSLCSAPTFNPILPVSPKQPGPQVFAQHLLRHPVCTVTSALPNLGAALTKGFTTV